MWSSALRQRNDIAQIPLAQLTTWRIGGMADVLTLSNEQDIPEVMAQSEHHFLGKGANLLVSDAPLRKPVIRLDRRFASSEWVAPGLLRVGAAHDLAVLVGRCCREGWGGLQGLAGVPASIGGALRMNAGTAHAWILDVVERVQVVVPGAGQLQWLHRSELTPVYRSAGLPPGTWLLACELRLHRADPEELLAHMRQCKQAKAASQPLAQASAGCVFKNPQPDLPAGKLIDSLGLKGRSCGAAVVSTQHANFIINTGGATAAQVARLIRHVRAVAKQQADIDLQMEVQVWEMDDQWFAPQRGDEVPPQEEDDHVR
ncbi:MAG: UDP-N-acetylmuramate dehydrogenase [Planctomycetota bacterium]|nr:MAG: UDP-N-acetylmuramate dehydrogenase [Planctomycetota bacterium]